MSDLIIRVMEHDDWKQVARLIYASTNGWYQDHQNSKIFSCSDDDMQLFCQVYEALDPRCCLIAQNPETKQILGNCFYHPRASHVSLGILNVHPQAFGQGIAGQLLHRVIAVARSRGLPLRLISSAMNLNSYSLYTKAGFVPRAAYQDMTLDVPTDGMRKIIPVFSAKTSGTIRAASLADVPQIVALEKKLNHIERGQDYRYFIQNKLSIWKVSILENAEKQILGFIVSVNHPASTLVGPALAYEPQQIAKLLYHQLNEMPGASPVFLIPVEQSQLVAELYGWGAKNCEIHFHQILGHYSKPLGVSLPTFMPETG